jgi:3-hydroxyisobutyrate dehydrogenase
MGGNMARNLVKNGRELVVFDVNDKAMDSVANGAPTGAVLKASSAKEVAERCSHVFTMLPTNQHVIDVYSNPDNGLVAGAKRGNFLVDCSTVSPDASKEVHRIASARGVEFHDAPVSGAEPAAIAATLTFMVGGPAAGVENITPYLLNMGKKVFNTGDIGSGSVAKICNNMLLAITMVGTSETLLLGQRLGLDPKLLTEIINVSSGRSWSSEIYNPVPGVMESVPSARGYSGGFLTKLMCKDLGLAQSVAHQAQTSIPLGSTCHQLFQVMMKNGFPDKDFSSVYQMLKGETPAK